MIKSALKSVFQALVRRTAPVRFADTTAVEPVSRVFGMDRGQPIDRFYIEAFLASQAHAIHGRGLEIAEVRYLADSPSIRERVVLAADRAAIKPHGADAVIVADLCDAGSLPEAAVDCFVCTQTLNFIYDVPAAVAGACRVLRPGGAFIGTVSGIAQISRYDADRWGDYWRFTEQSLRKLLQSSFDVVTVQPFGNMAAAIALLQGLAVEDLPSRKILEATDCEYPVILGFKAVKSE
ncbi:MAG: methyltransferase domain-containing protein [Caulobacteraceae bacterium]